MVESEPVVVDERLPGEPAGPRVGIWGTFDLENFGDLLFPRIFEHEIVRRLPSAQVRSFSPLGWDHPIALDGGFAAEPLGEPSAVRLAQLADELDLVAIGGGEIVHTRDEVYAHYYEAPDDVLARLRPSTFFIEGLGAAEDRTPVAWHAVGVPFDLEGDAAERVRSSLARRRYVAVRDEISRERLAKIGVERSVELVPDSAFLLERVFDADLRERRLSYLRALGAYPNSAPLVVQGSRALVEHVGAIGDAIAAQVEQDPSLPVVVLETGPCHGDHDFAEALVRHVPSVRRLPRELSVEDMVAAIAGSRGFVGISLHGNIAALVFGLPSAILDLAAYSKLDGFARLTGTLERRAAAADEVASVVAAAVAGRAPGGDLPPLVHRVDEHFDELAGLAEQTAGDLTTAAALGALTKRHAALRRAYAARSRQLSADRLRLAGSREHALGQALDAARADAAVAQAELEQAREDAAQLRAKHELEGEELRTERDAALEAIHRVESTKLFRFAAPFRRFSARLRRR